MELISYHLDDEVGVLVQADKKISENSAEL